MINKNMVAFNGEEKLKADLLAEIKKHEAADEISQGAYAEKTPNGMRLCAVGCALYSLNTIRGKDVKPNDHSAFEPELGIPRVLARLTDRIFEGLELEEAKKFPYQFIEAIPVGADLSLVFSKWIKWLLLDESEGVIKFARTDEQRAVIQKVGDLYTLKIDGVAVETKEWEEARKAAAADAAAAYAYAAAAYADADAYAYADAAAYAAAAYADAAAYAAAAYAAAYAADAAAADAAAAAADAAAAAADADAARRRAFHFQKEKLLELIKNAE